MQIYEATLPDQIRESYDFRVSGKETNRIGTFGRVNIFVGPNNSGKSLLLRGLFESTSVGNWIPNSPFYQDIVKKIRTGRSFFDNEIPGAISNRPVLVPYFDRCKKFIDEFEIPFVSMARKDFSSLARELPRMQDFQDRNWPNDLIQPVNSVLQLGLIASDFRSEDVFSAKKWRAAYIPTLRGFRTNPSDPKYNSNRTTSDYDFSTVIQTKQAEVFCGGDLYSQLQSNLLGKFKNRQWVANFENLLTESFFDGRRVQLIPHITAEGKPDLVYISVGNEKEQPIHKIGDGFQHLIVILFKAFELKNTIEGLDNVRAIFVEEPELFLHPGFQTKLIDCFLSKELEGVQLFATTHSNHLIDFVVDRNTCPVFRLKKRVEASTEEAIPSFEIQVLQPKDRTVLTELGVSRSSVLLSNCVVMVEGVTDRMYLQKFIEIFSLTQKTKYLVDLHYSFLEYGGSNITHYSFLDTEKGIDPSTLLGDFFLVADTDEGKAKADRIKKLKVVLGNRFVDTNVREIENLLTDSIVGRVVAKLEQDTPPNEFPCIAVSLHPKVGLGDVIDKALKKSGYTSKRRAKEGVYSYAQPSGTIKDKVDFCELAVSMMTTKEDLTEGALFISQKLYEFITEHNPR